MREWNFDGLVGPTHNYAGLSAGNIASATNEGRVSNPKAAALQGLDKMRFVRELGVGQAVFPPQFRPNQGFLKQLGFDLGKGGAARLQDAAQLLRMASSAASMWCANAATLAGAQDTRDQRLHLCPANLQAMLHRSIEAKHTHALLGEIFADPAHFCVHEPLPGGGQLADEGAANHTRLCAPGQAAVHLFAWGRSALDPSIPAPSKHPARQTFESSQALVRLLNIDPSQALLVRQDPRGIDAGAFHTDVLAVGNENVLLTHEWAFAQIEEVIAQLKSRIPGLHVCVATEQELPAQDAVASYPFNSQLLTVAPGKMVIIAPLEAKENPRAHAYLSRVCQEVAEVQTVHYLDLRQSMSNGGGPACLRLRVPLTDVQVKALGGRVVFDESLEADLRAWVEKHYRDELAPQDLHDPALWAEQERALVELGSVMELPGVYGPASQLR